MLSAITQQDFVQAAIGDDASLSLTPIGVFTPGMAMANDAGLSAITSPRDLAQAKALVQSSGYAGEKILLMAAADSPMTFAMAQVAAALFQQLGLNVDFVSMDLGSLVQRRTNKGSREAGGWDAFITTYEGLTMADPATNVALRGNGGDAWFGWPTSPRLEDLREHWLDAADLATQRHVARQIQEVALEEVPFIPLGQIFTATATRTDISHIVPAPFPLFWGVQRD